VQLICVETAKEMLAAVQQSLPADVFIAAAAVADWRVERIEASKIKKDKNGLPVLKFIENPDILAEVAASGEARPPVVVGFAAETDGLLANAQAKLTKKACDLIVANDVGVGSDVMGGLDNIVHIISRDKVESWPRLSKDLVAEKLVRHISLLLSNGDK
jgi:phosphopantothenoylcysteine decarboxylase/phosphopantothenate--cysteine ligase